jgi:toxin ParE1/3/4
MKWALVTETASEEIDLAKAFYDARGLGDKFIAQVEKTMAVISMSPELYPKVYKDVRRANLKHFPYGLFYVVEPDNSLVIGCLHHKRGHLAVVLKDREP